MTTRSALQTLILALIPDASIANSDVQNAITVAHMAFPGTYLVDHIDESLTLADNTYEYALPETSGVSTFVYIYSIWVESEVAGLFEMDLPNNNWRVEMPTTTSWQLRIDRRYPIIDGRKLRIEGQRAYVPPAADGDEIELHEGWVVQYVLGLLHASRGGTSSDNASWHRQMAMLHFAQAQALEDNINNRVRPGSVPVPGVWT